MKKNIFLKILILIICTSNANAGLLDRGRGLIYDTDLDITWLQDTNIAGTDMIWEDAISWVDTFEYQGFDDWRLPGSPATAQGFINEGELGHLYYTTLGNPIGGPRINDGPFENIPDTAVFWLNSTPLSTLSAWEFNFFDGFQNAGSRNDFQTVWVVRDGDSVPNASCPVDMVRAGENYCIDIDEAGRGVTWWQASEMCGDAGKRLCSTHEFHYACINGSGLGLINLPDGSESEAEFIDEFTDQYPEGFLSCEDVQKCLEVPCSVFRCCKDANGGYCGDGVINGTEQCDDGNATPGDGCSEVCTIEPNQAPTIDGVQGSNTVIEGETITLHVFASDPDGDPINLIVTLFDNDINSYAGNSFVDHGNGTGVLTANTGPGSAGTYNIVIIATDGVADAFLNMVLTVNP